MEKIFEEIMVENILKIENYKFTNLRSSMNPINAAKIQRKSH